LSRVRDFLNATPLEEGKGEKPELTYNTISYHIYLGKDHVAEAYHNEDATKIVEILNAKNSQITSLQSEVTAWKSKAIAYRKEGDEIIKDLQLEVERLKATAFSTQEVFKNMIQDRDEEIERLRTQSQEPVNSAELGKFLQWYTASGLTSHNHHSTNAERWVDESEYEWFGEKERELTLEQVLGKYANQFKPKKA
jgi:hypothetical protein